MGLLDRLRRRPSASGGTRLVGVWHLVRSDGLPPGEAELDIGDDGRLLYSIRPGDKWQIMRLTYRVEGDTLISNQPSASREERTRFRIEDDGTLFLTFGGERSWFRRGEKRAQPVAVRAILARISELPKMSCSGPGRRTRREASPLNSVFCL